MRKFYSKEIIPIIPQTKIISVTTTTSQEQHQHEPQPHHSQQQQLKPQSYPLDVEKSISNFYHLRQRDSDEALEYLCVFFTFGYFFHYLPYRFSKSSATSTSSTSMYVIRTSVTHKIICALIHVVTLFRFITVLREVQVTHSDPTSYFIIARNFATCIYIFTFMFSFWKNQLVFQDLFKDIGDKMHLFNNNGTKGRGGTSIRTLAYFLCILYTLISLMNVVFGHGLVRMSEWSLHGLLEKHASYTRFMFFLDGNSTLTESDLDLESPAAESNENVNSMSVYVLTIFHLGIHFYFKLGAHYADLSILICALTLQHLTRKFIASFERQREQRQGQDDVLNVLDQYNALKIVARKINIGIGAITLCCMLEAMPYYATHIGDILNITQDWFVRFRYMFFILNFCSIIFISADISHKVGLLQEWLNEDHNYKLIPQSKLIVLTNELTYSRIGLSAMGLFTITYGFIGSLISIVIMYVVIILQFKMSVEACQPVHL